LKNWTEQSTFKAKHSECPDMFELPIDGQNLPKHQGETKWVFHFGSGRYFIGEFDGKTFTKEEGLYQLDYGQFYASQTWKNVPRLKSGEKRTIQVAWVIGSGIRGMPFSDQFTFPCELSLKNCPQGLRVCRTPIREIKNLYQRTHSWENVLLSDTNLLDTIRGELFDMEAEFDFGDAEELTLNIRNHPMVISAKDRFIAFNGKKMPIAVVDNRVKVRILIDRASVEVFANQGQSVLTRSFTPKAENRSLVLTAKTPGKGRPVKVLTMQVHPLKSTWRK
jgi:fructan beta-fructosidase